MSPSFMSEIDRLRSLKATTGTEWVSRSAYHFFPCETEETMAAIEESSGFPVPPDLKCMLLTLGGFYSPIDTDGFSITFRNRPGWPEPFGGLADVLESMWYWEAYRDPDTYTEAAIHNLNTNFVCFGHCEIDENTADHFFYDRNGHFGVLRFNQDFVDHEGLSHLHQLLDGVNPRPPLTLEEALAPYADFY